MQCPESQTADVNTSSTTLFVDGHVHYFDCFGLRRFLDSAFDNVQAARSAAGVRDPVVGCLMLCECGTHCPWDRIGRDAASLDGPWSIKSSDEEESLFVYRDGQLVLVLVAGRQIVTSDRLEVLALGTLDPIAHGASLRDTVRNVRQCKAMPVVPWGFGKWWFRRGRSLTQLLGADAKAAALPEEELFLGDNGNRTRWLGSPTAFRRAASRGIRILPGSDPLPLASHAARVGSYGFFLHADRPVDRPLRQIKELLSCNRAQPRTWGRLASLGAFCTDQVFMQARKQRLLP